MVQDIKTLKLTPNPAPSVSTTISSSTDRPQFVCPLTFKEMNGVQPFLYIVPCGCVLSQAGLRTVSGATPTPPLNEDGINGKDQEKQIDPDATGKQLDVCPQCSTKFDSSDDLILLNPTPDEEARLRAALERRRLLEPPKKAKKRKGAPTDADLPSKKRPNVTPPSISPSIAAANRALASSLAMEEAKRKAGMSDAVKSMYSSDSSMKRKETFMTMGTFTRVRVLL